MEKYWCKTVQATGAREDGSPRSMSKQARNYGVGTPYQNPVRLVVKRGPTTIMHGKLVAVACGRPVPTIRKINFISLAPETRTQFTIPNLDRAIISTRIPRWHSTLTLASAGGISNTRPTTHGTTTKSVSTCSMTSQLMGNYVKWSRTMPEMVSSIRSTGMMVHSSRPGSMSTN